jgi:hypothetical protein
MKKILFAFIGVAALFASSCKKEDVKAYQKPLISGGSSNVDTLIGDITVNTTVTRTTYLKGLVYVRPGITLTVNAGVTIKGSLETTSTPDVVDLTNNKGTLIVEQGGRLVAIGTASSPIVWTSERPAGQRNFGDWGGIVLLGQAPIITATGASTNVFEAFTALTNGRNSYGGNVANDNSGSIVYNRVEFAGGIVAAQNREVNGITFCGVGSGTTINHVEVSNSGDDAFEFFGGTVSADHLLAFGTKDDDYDFDENYNGTLQFIIAYRTDLADNSGSELIELDNNAAATLTPTRTTPFIANATLIGPSSLTVRSGVVGSFDGGIWLRRAGRIIFANSLVAGQALTNIIATTATTNSSLLNPNDPIPSYMRNNIFQTTSSTPVILDANEANPIAGTADNALINVLGNSTNKNTAVATFNDFKLDGGLKPLAGSPALSGGLNLGSFGLVGTTQRGGVITSDPWTTTGSWISISSN